VRRFLSELRTDLMGDRDYADKLREENLSFLRTDRAFEKCMENAHKKWRWVHKKLAWSRLWRPISRPSGVSPEPPAFSASIFLLGSAQPDVAPSSIVPLAEAILNGFTAGLKRLRHRARRPQSVRPIDLPWVPHDVHERLRRREALSKE
jgi:hypothetical protein